MATSKRLKYLDAVASTPVSDLSGGDFLLSETMWVHAHNSLHTRMEALEALAKVLLACAGDSAFDELVEGKTFSQLLQSQEQMILIDQIIGTLFIGDTGRFDRELTELLRVTAHLANFEVNSRERGGFFESEFVPARNRAIA